MSHPADPFAPAFAKAHEWLARVSQSLGTEDRAFAYRTMRAWFHTIRDRMTITAAAHMSAQMPELLRGMFFEGWVPSRVPVRHGTEAFVEQFAREAGIARAEVPMISGVITDALDTLFSPGQLDRAFAVLPPALVRTIWGQTPVAEFEEDAPPTHTDAEQPDRLTALEDRLQALSDAFAALVRGLENKPGSRLDDQQIETAAERAHRILLAQGIAHSL